MNPIIISDHSTDAVQYSDISDYQNSGSSDDDTPTVRPGVITPSQSTPNNGLSVPVSRWISEKSASISSLRGSGSESHNGSIGQQHSAPDRVANYETVSPQNIEVPHVKSTLSVSSTESQNLQEEADTIAPLATPGLLEPPREFKGRERRAVSISSTQQSLPILFVAANQLAKFGQLGNESESDTGQNMIPDVATDFDQLVDLTLIKEDGVGLGFSIVDHPPFEGVFVSAVIEGSAAKKCGLRPNDRILGLNGQCIPAKDRSDAAVILRSLPLGRLDLRICRGGNSVVVHKSLSQYCADMGYTPTSFARSDSRLEKENGNIPPTSPSRQTSQNAPAHKKSTEAKPNFMKSEVLPQTTELGNKQVNINIPLTETKPKNTGQPSMGVASQLGNFPIANQKSKESTTSSNPSSLHGPIFLVAFLVEIVLGIVLIILECITAGVFTYQIFGAEYVGIYVGVFAVCAGMVGLWTNRKKDHSRTLQLLNLILTAICCVQALALFCASAGLLSRHVNDNNNNYYQIGNNDAASVAQRVDLTSLIGLKAAVLSFYLLLFFTNAVICVIIFMNYRRLSS